MPRVEIEVDAGLVEGGVAAVVSKEEGVGGQVKASINPALAKAVPSLGDLAPGIAGAAGYQTLAPLVAALTGLPWAAPVLAGALASYYLYTKNKK